MQWVSGTAETPVSGHPGQELPTAGPSGDKPGLGALPLRLGASRQAGSFSSSPALVTAKADRVPAPPNRQNRAGPRELPVGRCDEHRPGLSPAGPGPLRRDPGAALTSAGRARPGTAAPAVAAPRPGECGSAGAHRVTGARVGIGGPGPLEGERGGAQGAQVWR